mmetsp:Transcript_128/g.330  ORF Transcript_128/g.330 Transcript_128/m.330 type:complete len:327 (+) Transcript_128:1735-2715(+)
MLPELLLLRFQLRVPLLVLLVVPLVPFALQVELLLMFPLLLLLSADAFLKGLLVLVRLLHILLDLLQLLLLAADLVQQIVQLLLLDLVLDPEVLHLLLQVLLPALLPVDLAALRLHELLYLGDVVLRLPPLLLHALDLLEAAGCDAPEHLRALLQHVPVLLQLVALRRQLRELELLLGAHAGAFLNALLQVGDLRLVLVDGLLGLLLLLQRLLHQLLLRLDVSAEVRDRLLVLGGRFHRRLNALGARADLGVEVADLLREALLGLVGPHERLVQLLVLRAEWLEDPLPRPAQLLQGLLVVLLQGLHGSGRIALVGRHGFEDADRAR